MRSIALFTDPASPARDLCPSRPELAAPAPAPAPSVTCPISVRVISTLMQIRHRSSARSTPRVLDPALVGNDDDSAPWFELLNHGLSKEKVAVKNKPGRGGGREWRAVDFLSTILPAHVYEVFHLPDPGPDDMLEQLARERVRGMRADQHKAALAKMRSLRTYLDAVERALGARPTR
jgi:hypothetical protein